MSFVSDWSRVKRPVSGALIGQPIACLHVGAGDLKLFLFWRYDMKIASKVIGSVNPSTLCRSDGQLLFACGNDVIITGGENGQQLVFKFFRVKTRARFLMITGLFLLLFDSKQISKNRLFHLISHTSKPSPKKFKFLD